MPRVLVVQNGPDGGPGRFGAWLVEEGLALDVVHGYDDSSPGVPERLTHQALLVLGGGFLPDEDDRAPWLAPTRKLAAQALASGVPYFGICLGGQLLAHVAGGTVRGEHGAPEVGSTTLSMREEAASDHLFGGLPEQVTAIQNHVDTITALPSGSPWLMQSERCPYQAFRVGQRAWGVQFHPEAAAAQTRRWTAERLHRLGFEPQEVHRRAEADEPAAAAVWREVARRFAGVVHGAAGAA
ncbi:type 1 glutamine amidotransferase [Streptomyces sp. TR06-5]|uniref:type 1 glutamine amidotransferase n=1 Tax=unclassified Streptomyces TaxID=2593676 RepID=UPI00399F86D2